MEKNTKIVISSYDAAVYPTPKIHLRFQIQFGLNQGSGSAAVNVAFYPFCSWLRVELLKTGNISEGKFLCVQFSNNKLISLIADGYSMVVVSYNLVKRHQHNNAMCFCANSRK